MLDLKRLDSLIADFPRLRIGLVGDLVLDRYLEIAPGVFEESIETGLEAYQVGAVRNSPGALGTVMNNLAALGVGSLVPVTVLGDDGHASDLFSALADLPVELDLVVQEPGRHTPTYTKPMKQDADGNWCELNRLDFRSRGPLQATTVEVLKGNIERAFRECDGIIVLDQFNEDGWGVVNSEIRQTLADLADQSPDKLIFVDSRKQLGQFSRGTLKGNRAELEAAGGSQQVEESITRLADRTGKPVFCTLGEQGVMVGFPGGQFTSVAGLRVDGPLDIVGAGDSATSGIVTAMLCGATELEAASLGNLVASITVQQLGRTGTASPEQLRERIRQIG